jgi:hypothetical protein
MDFKFIAELPEDQNVVQMIEHQGSVYVATNKQIFKIVENKCLPLKIGYIEGTNTKGQ